MIIGQKLYTFLDHASRRLPPALLRIFAMPINYQISSKDSLIYESARMLDTAFAFCMNNKIQGDYAEFGVFEGRAFSEAWKSSTRYGFLDTTFWAFDSFKGLPEIAGNDIGGPFVEGEFISSRKTFEKNLAKVGFDFSRIRIVEGFFNKSLLESNFESDKLDAIAIAWVDCDLYESTVPVLKFLTNRLVNGSVLIFDDWFCYDGGGKKGEQLACAEWLEQNPNIRLVEYQNFHWAGKSFIVNRV